MLFLLVIFFVFAVIPLAVILGIVLAIAIGKAKKDAWRILDQSVVDPAEVKKVIKTLGVARDIESKELSRKLMDRLPSPHA